MAVALELRYSKDELMDAYVNEIYLGQDGARAVHGFGLASQFYFGKPLDELELHELALLVAEVRGPAYYDPRRHPDRALERRNLVLEVMRDEGLISARRRGSTPRSASWVSWHATPSAARRNRRSWVSCAASSRWITRPRTLERKGLTVFSTLDPAAQAAAERALTRGSRGARSRRPPASTARSSSRARIPARCARVVGGGRTDFDGFNRALDARRQIGSLIKPALYLAALESGRYNAGEHRRRFADRRAARQRQDVWSPQDFDKGRARPGAAGAARSRSR